MDIVENVYHIPAAAKILQLPEKEVAKGQKRHILKVSADKKEG